LGRAVGKRAADPSRRDLALQVGWLSQRVRLDPVGVRVEILGGVQDEAQVLDHHEAVSGGRARGVDEGGGDRGVAMILYPRTPLVPGAVVVVRGAPEPGDARRLRLVYLAVTDDRRVAQLGDRAGVGECPEGGLGELLVVLGTERERAFARGRDGDEDD